MTMRQERREYTRIYESAGISFNREAAPRPRHAMSRDISRGGIRFFVDEIIPDNTVLSARITLPLASLSFKTPIRVKWIKKASIGTKFEAGAEFLNISDDINVSLSRYIESRKDRYGLPLPSHHRQPDPLPAYRLNSFRSIIDYLKKRFGSDV